MQRSGLHLSCRLYALTGAGVVCLAIFIGLMFYETPNIPQHVEKQLPLERFLTDSMNARPQP